jgi:hypothetical protein
VFADHMSGRIWAMPVSGSKAAGAPREIANQAGITDVQDDPQGEVYLVCLDDNKVFTLAPGP